MMSNGPRSVLRLFQSGVRAIVAASTSLGEPSTCTCRKPSLRRLRKERRSSRVWFRITWGPKSRSGRSGFRSRQSRSETLKTIATGRKWCSSLEHRKLGRRADFAVLRPDREEPHRVAEAPCDLAGPVLELGPRPLEAMVAVAEAPGRKAVEADVVLTVGRRDGDRAGPRLLEQDALESAQAWRVEMLDHLDHRCGVEPGETSRYVSAVWNSRTRS